MYRVLLERAAEKDLARLSSGMHDRVIAAIQSLANDPRPPGCRKLTGSKNDGASAWVIIGWCMRLLMSFVWCASTAYAIGKKRIADVLHLPPEHDRNSNAGADCPVGVVTELPKPRHLRQAAIST